MPERRTETRYDVAQSARLSLLHSEGLQKDSCTVVDVSRSGMRIRVGTFIAPGTEIHVHLRTLTALGHVRYCRQAAPGEFNVGIAITETVAVPDVAETPLMEHVSKADLELHVLGRLAPSQSAEITRHLQDCAECDAALRDARDFVSHLNSYVASQG